MRTIIIADSLTNDFLNPDEPFASCGVNLGAQEIARLMGDPAGYGPLPQFLLAASRNADVGLILVRDLHDPEDPMQQPELLRYGPHNLAGSPGARFVTPILPIVNDAQVIDTHTLAVPLTPLRAALREILGRDFLEMTHAQRQELRFILTGVHTDKRILATAALLRNVLDFEQVGVCPHLVGSANREAHLATVKKLLPDALVTLFPGLSEIADWGSIDLSDFDCSPYLSCAILPTDMAARLDAHQTHLVKTLFTGYGEVKLKALSGGFSGSFLFLARGKLGKAAAQPMVMKIDSHQQIQREVNGYGLVKELLGHHVPGFDTPVSFGTASGIRMDLAAMNGAPVTLQALFEGADDQERYNRFLDRLSRALLILSEKLYQNTAIATRIAPCRRLGLSSPRQQDYLVANIRNIVEGWRPGLAISLTNGFTLPDFCDEFLEVCRSEQWIDATLSLAHGDLNLANIISDDNGNIWIIDWTHAGYHPADLDLAKLENDIKIVLGKSFSEDDLPRLAAMEHYLLERFQPKEMAELPSALSFIRDDSRFQKAYRAVRRIRLTARVVRGQADEEGYFLALLRYAAHTLSFDQRQGRGECSLPQLKYALLSCHLLVEHLLHSPFLRQTTAVRPDGYPERLRVEQEEAPWSVALPDYDPPYFVHETVLAQERIAQGWADAENLRRVAPPRAADGSPLPLDNQGRPLNPMGRTGIGGRGLLGRWGINEAVDALVMRHNPQTGHLELLLGQRADTLEWALPGTMLLPGETREGAWQRALAEKCGIGIPLPAARELFRGPIADFRNTDHAWIETCAALFHLDAHAPEPVAGAGWRQAAWRRPQEEVIDALFGGHGALVRLALACYPP